MTIRSRQKCGPTSTTAKSAASSISRPPPGRVRISQAVEKEINEEVARFLDAGPTAEELQRVKTQYVARFIRGVDRIGGFGGKSDVLAHGQAFLADPDFYKTQLKRVASRYCGRPEVRRAALALRRRICPRSASLPGL